MSAGSGGMFGLSPQPDCCPQLLEMKSTDRKQTLLHYMVRVINDKYPELTGFHTELHFLDKAGTGTGMWLGLRATPRPLSSKKGTASDSGSWLFLKLLAGRQSLQLSIVLSLPLPTQVSLDSMLQDVRSLQQGMELTRKEFMRQDDSQVLKDFLKANTEVMEKLQTDGKTAKVGASAPYLEQCILELT